MSCARCAPVDALAAWDLRNEVVTTLVDEVHRVIVIERCPPCDQRWMRTFDERVRYDGEPDDQYGTLFPVDPQGERIAGQRWVRWVAGAEPPARWMDP